MHSFEREFAVSPEDLATSLAFCSHLAWLDFWLNPRRLRGSDFLMRWSQGAWSEERLVEAVARTGEFFALPYGPSGTAPADDVRAAELYFERLDAAGLKSLKRPDLLIFPVARQAEVSAIAASLGGPAELPFHQEAVPAMQQLLAWALLAIECENSLWRTSAMPDFGKPLRPQKRLGGLPGLAKSAVVPTIIIKEEDRQPLVEWQRTTRIPLHVWHVFFDRAYGIAFDEAERLISSGQTQGSSQVFQAPGGATTTKMIYKHIYHHTYELAVCSTAPSLAAQVFEDKNGHVLPYVTFQGGSFELQPPALELLRIRAAVDQ